MKKTKKEWTNRSWEAPPGPYAWTCLVCEAPNASGDFACVRCGCPDRLDGREIFERQRQFKLGLPYDGTHRSKPRSRIPGRRLDGSNTFSPKKLLEGFIFLLAAWAGMFQATAFGYVTVLSSRNQEGIQVSDPLALTIAVVGYVCVLLNGIAIWADHLDRRTETESLYQSARHWSIGIGGSCMLVSAALHLSSG